MLKRKAIFILIVSLFFIFAGYPNTNAGNLQKPMYSKISTSFLLSKKVKCDRVKARFEIYAEGDNYNTALKRLAKINNDFLDFLRKIFPEQNIQTSNAYGYSKTAILYVSINSKKLERISSVLRYIASKNFQYKTGIKPIYIIFGVSNELKHKIENLLFKEALTTAESKIKMTNNTLSANYKMQSLDIGFNSGYPVLYERNTFRTLYKGETKSPGLPNTNIQTSPGSITIKINVRLEMIKRLD